MAKEVVQNGASGTVSRPTVFQQFIDKLELEASMSADEGFDADAITADVIERMFAADTLEDAVKAQDSSLVSGKELGDVEMLVTDFTVRKSDAKYQDHGLKHYVIVSSVRLSDGSEFKWATGAPNLITILWIARQQERLPWECVIKGRTTENGELLTLRDIPARAVKV